MTSQGYNPFGSDYRNTFGNSYIRQFDVYVSPEEKIGRISEVRTNAEGRFQDIVVMLDAPADRRRILLPFNRIQVNQQQRRVHVNGLSKAEAMNLPPYESDRVDHLPSVASAPHAQTRSGESIKDKLDNTAQISTKPDQGTTVRLHEERLVVDRSQRRKVGEVIVRKEIETRMIEVPVRHEKLIVEQVSPVYERLAVVNLEPNQTEFQDVTDDRFLARSSSHSSVSGDFTSAEAASRFLDAIAHHPRAGHEKIQIRILLREGTDQDIYQRWLDRYLE